MSVPSSLLPADARGVDGHLRTRHDDPHRILDRVHDHVLRLLGEEEVAARVLTDVAARASARARDLGEVPTFAALVGLAHARMASTSPTRPDDALVARLAGSRERAGRTLVAAMASAAVGADGRGAALLDLTARHDIELRRAAAWIGIERATAERARTEALRQIHAALADRGPVPDVPAMLARLPVVKAPPQVHHVADLSGATAQRRPLPSAVAWLGTAAAVLGTVAAITVGLPTLASADLDGAPVATAEGVIDGPAVRQLATPGDDVPEGGVEPLAVHDSTEQEQAAPPSSETTTDESEPELEPTPSPEPSPTEDAPEPEEEPTDEPSEEPTEEPSPEPSEGPLDDLLPTDP